MKECNRHNSHAANESRTQLTAVIAGAGPAGLTAAYELASRSGIHPIIAEATDEIGGISKTVCHNGNRIDIGGHRFFSKSDRVMQWWGNIMPVQTAPAHDEKLLGGRFATGAVAPNADQPERKADPETTDRVMLIRRRVSRIYYLRRFFDYPISMSLQTISALGIWRTLRAGFGYLAATIRKRPENSLEDFYINRFGKTLYRMFFEDYTEKVWGLHPSKLGADWGSQRVKGLSVMTILKDMLLKKLSRKRDNARVETSLIEEFIYPKLGPGQLWETVAGDIAEKGGDIKMQTAVKRIHVKGNRVEAVTVATPDGSEQRIECDYFISSMPLKDLIPAIDGIEIPTDVAEIAGTLPYRDFMTVGLLVDKLKIKNRTRLATYADRIPDTWIYVQERDVRLGRIQVFNNWSPYMVKDYENKIWIGLEYFCFEGDTMWRMSDREFTDMAINELAHIGIIDPQDVEDSVRIRIRKAYPAYYGSYYRLDRVKQFLDSIENLYCIGRNGQHRYNNMDHSMLTAMETVDAITSPKPTADKSSIWNVNTETDYHEAKK